MSTIKPCPFCGKTDVTVCVSNYHDERVATCGYCGARSCGVALRTTGKDTQEQMEIEAENRALKNWNTRSAP